MSYLYGKFKHASHAGCEPMREVLNLWIPGFSACFAICRALDFLGACLRLILRFKAARHDEFRFVGVFWSLSSTSAHIQKAQEYVPEDEPQDEPCKPER